MSQESAASQKGGWSREHQKRAKMRLLTPAQRTRLIELHKRGGAVAPYRLASGAALAAWTRAGHHLALLELVDEVGWHLHLTARGAEIAAELANRAEARAERAALLGRGWRAYRCGYAGRGYTYAQPGGVYMRVVSDRPGAPWRWFVSSLGGKDGAWKGTCATAREACETAEAKRRELLADAQARQAYQARKLERAALYARRDRPAAPAPEPTPPRPGLCAAVRRLPRPALHLRNLAPLARLAALVAVLLQLGACAPAPAWPGNAWVGALMLAVSVLGLCFVDPPPTDARRAQTPRNPREGPEPATPCHIRRKPSSPRHRLP